MEDAQHLAEFHAMALEFESILIRFNRMRNGVTDKLRLIQIQRDQIAALKESLHKNERVLNFMEGKPYEPETHFAESVLQGVGGGGTLF